MSAVIRDTSGSEATPVAGVAARLRRMLRRPLSSKDLARGACRALVAVLEADGALVATRSEEGEGFSVLERAGFGEGFGDRSAAAARESAPRCWLAALEREGVHEAREGGDLCGSCALLPACPYCPCLTVEVPCARAPKHVLALGISEEDAQDVDVRLALEVAATALGPAFDAAWLAEQAARGESAADASSHRFREIVEGNADGVVIVDTDGHILFANDAAKRFFGRELSGAFGDSLKLPVHDETHVNLEVERPDGTRVVGETRYAALDWDGAPALLISIRDVTVQHGLERQLRQAQKMEAVGQLAGGVAHDFNNILQTVLAHSQFARDEIQDEAAVIGHLGTIRESAQRAVALTRQLLAVSRHQVLQRRAVELNAQVEESLGLLRRVLGEDIELVSRLEASPSWIVADPNQLDQVLMNLCLNARDAMPKGGRITVVTKNVTKPPADVGAMIEQVAGRFVRLEIRDDGEGMSEQTRARIFEPFFTTKESGKGTGLGLSTVFGIVSQHGGTIDVESALGEGTSFLIDLPEGDPNERRTPPHTPTPRAILKGGHEKILLAEDDDHVRRAAIRILRAGGYEVVAVRNGREAIDTFTGDRDHEISLVFLDVVMPGASGREVFRVVREKRPGFPVLFVSGYSPVRLTDEVELDDRTDIIAKPYSAEEVLGTIARLLEAG